MPRVPKLSSDEVVKMKEYIKRQTDTLWFSTTTVLPATDATTDATTATTVATTTAAATTATTTMQPYGASTTPAPKFTDLLKRKLQSIGSWCKNCYNKAKEVVKDVLGLDDCNAVYRKDDNIEGLI